MSLQNIAYIWHMAGISQDELTVHFCLEITRMFGKLCYSLTKLLRGCHFSLIIIWYQLLLHCKYLVSCRQTVNVFYTEIVPKAPNAKALKFFQLSMIGKNCVSYLIILLMTSRHWNTFRTVSPLWEKSTGDRWISHRTPWISCKLTVMPFHIKWTSNYHIVYWRKCMYVCT